MRRFLDELRRHARQFFTNWREYDAPVRTKVRLTFRNRWHAIVLLKGCCGNAGEPGC